MDSRSPSPPLPFPSRRGTKKLVTGADEEPSTSKDSEIFELCQETLGALQELRHGIQFALYDKLELINVDAVMLAKFIEEDSSIACALIEKDVDELSTERLIEILEKLQFSTRGV